MKARVVFIKESNILIPYLFSTELCIGKMIHWVQGEGRVMARLCNKNESEIFMSNDWVGQKLGPASLDADWVKDGDVVEANFKIEGFETYTNLIPSIEPIKIKCKKTGEYK